MSKLNYNNAVFKSSYGLSSQLPEADKLEFVFSGRSNVGKSSLINKLCNRKNLARVSGTPGKTATINYYDIENVYFVDLPGYGYAKVSNSERKRWDDLINSYFNANRHRAMLFQLLDCRHAPSAEDIVMLDYLQHYNIQFMVVLTKGDKLKKSQVDYTITNFENICTPYGCKGVILSSADNGLGIGDLQEKIEFYINNEEI
ncbi:MAG: ribosome biogenesis GTP-binding protein YihA/YsxC [Oscillospiraceae bacterium]